jgi:hypothetical protein
MDTVDWRGVMIYLFELGEGRLQVQVQYEYGNKQRGLTHDVHGRLRRFTDVDPNEAGRDSPSIEATSVIYICMHASTGLFPCAEDTVYVLSSKMMLRAIARKFAI